MLRRSHTCRDCGWVSDRPARAFAIVCALFGALLMTSEPWALRLAIALLGGLSIQLVTHGTWVEQSRVRSGASQR